MTDVPSPIDLRNIRDAKAWEASALSKRPSRPEFFARFAVEIANHPTAIRNVLELGSGPGFLAEYLLSGSLDCSYVALDFSAAMHELARSRLGALASRVEFVESSFKENNWTKNLGSFDCVVTNQAVHELRHKRHATELHRQVREVLKPGGLYLMCDHFAGILGMADKQLYMTEAEQQAALTNAGFSDVRLIKTADSLNLFKATN